MSAEATTTGSMLPDGFADLEPFAPTWALADANERYEQRRASTMAELQAFYDAMLARSEDAFTHLDQYPLDDLPPRALNLFYLLASLSVVGFAVDVFKQPKVPDSNGATLAWSYTPAP